MKTLLISLMFCLSACSTMIVKTWHVNPADQERFVADQAVCDQKARAVYSLTGHYEDVFDYCLQMAGYRLTVTRE